MKGRASRSLAVTITMAIMMAFTDRLMMDIGATMAPSGIRMLDGAGIAMTDIIFSAAPAQASTTSMELAFTESTRREKVLMGLDQIVWPPSRAPAFPYVQNQTN